MSLMLAGCAPNSPANTEATRAAADPFSEPVSTFSIVAHDPATGDLGVAVASKFFAVGSVVPWARAGVGAVATQSWANTAHGPAGLDLLAAGMRAEEAQNTLLEADPGRAQRQMAIVDARGAAATFTGSACMAWAGGRTGDGYAVQGNILAGPEVVDAMATAFELSTGDLGSRLLEALAAGQAAGGDARGRQSAALLVVRERGGFMRQNDRFIDVRVDDHARPIEELRRLLDIRHGQLATEAASRHQGDGDLDAALAEATRATTLYAHDGIAWLTLAQVHLARTEHAAAAAAARQALIRDPWLKTAMLDDVGGVGRLVEALLQIDDFARFWETLPARR